MVECRDSILGCRGGPGEHVFRVLWAEGGTSDERDASTETLHAITHSEMVLESELNGRVIRVFRSLDKTWFTGKIGGYDPLKHEHKINYADGQSEDLNLLELMVNGLHGSLRLSKASTLVSKVISKVISSYQITLNQS